MTPVVLLFIAIPVLALAVDVGRMAWNRRELQEVADLGAIDAMRAFGQCRETAGDPVAAAQASALRNGYDGNLALAPNAVQIGSVSTLASGVRQFTAGGVAATATAVRVFATRRVPFTMIASALLPGDATLQVEAVAAREAVASISAGSFAARVDTSDSSLLNPFFGGMLGGNVALTAVSYQGIAAANFTVGDLVAAANVGSVDELLALELSSTQYLDLLGDALSDSGNASAAASLNMMAAAADSALSVSLASVLDIAAGSGDAALDAQLNAFDMLDVGAQVARGDSAILIDPLTVSVPGVTASAKIRIIQAPRIAVGPPGKNAAGEWNTQVRTGQVRMAVHLAVGSIAIFGSGAAVSVDLFVEGAQTKAHLDAIDCADASDPVHRAFVGAEPGLVRLGIGKYPNFQTSPDPVATDLVNPLMLTITLPLVGTVTVPVAKVTGFSDVPYQSSGEDLQFDGPFVPQIDEPSDDNTQTVGTPLGDGISTALSTLLSSSQLQVSLLGSTTLTVSQTNSAIAAVTNQLQPVFDAIDAPITQLFAMTGITLGGADITLLSLNADQPALAR
jgi:tight adherence protein G